MYYKLRYPCECDQLTKTCIDLTPRLAVLKICRIPARISNSRIAAVQFAVHPDIDAMYTS